MAVYDLEEQEQLAELKTWWKLHGNRVTSLVTVAVLAVAGWQGWNWWQREQSTQASALYAGVEKAAVAKDAKQARQLTGELIDKFPRTAYAPLAAMLSARVQVEAGESKNAQPQLQWAAENAGDDALRDLARLRLATVLLDDKSYDEALKQLAVTPGSAFAPRYAELKGDVLLAQGKQAEAVAAYQAGIAALETLRKTDNAPPHGAYLDLLKLKMEAAGSQ
ncbi:MAG: tetratricopeptide repeat protein [Rhodocyclaceae bacterium]|nr:tetratricopeptide repeat protein [Rhodocyclaceae bacterium]